MKAKFVRESLNEERVTPFEYTEYVAQSLVDALAFEHGYDVGELNIDSFLQNKVIQDMIMDMYHDKYSPKDAARQLYISWEDQLIDAANMSEGWKDRVEKNTRKRLSKVPGLSLSPEEEDEYMNRYKEAHGTPLRSKRMARNIEGSIYNDRNEPMNNVYEFGDELVKELKSMGWEDAYLTGAGRTKDGMPSVGIEIEGKEFEFHLDINRELYSGRKHLGDWSDNLIDTRPAIKKLLV